MKLIIEGTTQSETFEVKNTDEMMEKLELFMKSKNIENCVFQLNGEAGIKKVVELSCLFG